MTRNRHILTELPGPKARALIARDAEVISPSYPRDYPFVMSHGRGTEVWDVDGNRFLDFAAGIAVCSTGHAHPQVVQAVKDAADRFLHISSDYWHEQMAGLGERLARIAPLGEPAMSFLCQSGTEAVEASIKLARYVTGRSRFIGFLGGFHGRTMGSLAFTSSKYTQQKGFFATMPGVTHVPYPNPYRAMFAGSDQGKAVLDYIRMLFERSVPASEVAAILVEPIQGEGGYIVPPDGFLAGLRALCDEHGILLIFDEVQSGIGRTGRMFASQHWGVQPDIMTLAKGLGSGLPIGAMVAKKRLMSQWKRGAHGNTYGGNPIACAAANATIDLVEKGHGRQCRHGRRALHGAAARPGARLSVHRRGSRQGPDDRHGTGRSRCRAHAGARALRCRHHPRLPQRPAAAVVRRQHGALHAAAERDARGDRRGDGAAAHQPRRSAARAGGLTRCGRDIAVLAAALLGAAAGAAWADGREPVLKQVDLPHSYYWRELYLPQLTTGPSSAGFLPDGELARVQHGRFAVAPAHRRRRSGRADPCGGRVRLPARRRARRAQRGVHALRRRRRWNCGGWIWPAAVRRH